jgi:hypothetical protein
VLATVTGIPPRVTQNGAELGWRNYLQETKQENHRAQQLYAGAVIWFTNMDQNTKAFLETYKP